MSFAADGMAGIDMDAGVVYEGSHASTEESLGAAMVYAIN